MVLDEWGSEIRRGERVKRVQAAGNLKSVITKKEKKGTIVELEEGKRKKSQMIREV